VLSGTVSRLMEFFLSGKNNSQSDNACRCVTSRYDLNAFQNSLLNLAGWLRMLIIYNTVTKFFSILRMKNSDFFYSMCRIWVLKYVFWHFSVYRPLCFLKSAYKLKFYHTVTTTPLPFAGNGVVKFGNGVVNTLVIKGACRDRSYTEREKERERERERERELINGDDTILTCTCIWVKGYELQLSGDEYSINS